MHKHINTADGPDNFEGLAPEGYVIDTSGIWKLGLSTEYMLDRETRTRIAYAPVVVLGAGDNSIRVAWLRGFTWKYRWTRRSELLNEISTVLIDDGFPVTANTVSQMIDYIAAAEAEYLQHNDYIQLLGDTYESRIPGHDPVNNADLFRLSCICAKDPDGWAAFVARLRAKDRAALLARLDA